MKLFKLGKGMMMSGLFVPTAKQVILFKGIKNLDDALKLFDEMLKWKPKPFARLNNKLLNIMKLSLSGGRVDKYTIRHCDQLFTMNLKEEARLGLCSVC
ncbi:hypothetical protein Leryth_026529 [Lithospermum erythrorhizon]|nr:hypothetical protein Leryth_026529 [Lithospermum erythrorhizon]